MSEMTDRVNQLTDWSKQAQEHVQSAIGKNEEELSAAIEQVQRETEERAEQLRRVRQLHRRLIPSLAVWISAGTRDNSGEPSWHIFDRVPLWVEFAIPTRRARLPPVLRQRLILVVEVQ